MLASAAAIASRVQPWRRGGGRRRSGSRRRPPTKTAETAETAKKTAETAEGRRRPPKTATTPKQRPERVVVVVVHSHLESSHFGLSGKFLLHLKVELSDVS